MGSQPCQNSCRPVWQFQSENAHIDGSSELVLFYDFCAKKTMQIQEKLVGEYILRTTVIVWIEI